MSRKLISQLPGGRRKLQNQVIRYMEPRLGMGAEDLGLGLPRRPSPLHSSPFALPSSYINKCCYLLGEALSTLEAVAGGP